jgi:hypothetical protein
MSLLDELPVELQYYIITMDDEVVRLARQLNHFYRDLIKWPYFRRWATQPIRANEIETYLETLPVRFALFNWSDGICRIFTLTQPPSVWNRHLWSQPQPQSIIYRMDLVSIDYYIFNPALYLSWSYQYQYPPSCIQLDDIIAYLHQGYEPDLLSQFEIYASRLDLIAIQPNYPRHRINDIIQKQAEDYLQSNPEGCKGGMADPNARAGTNAKAVKLWIQVKIMDYLSDVGPLRLNEEDNVSCMIISCESPEHQAIHATASRWGQLALLYF